MAGSALKKRPLADGSKGKPVRPSKKQRKIAAYHSSSSDEESGADNDDQDSDNAPVPANLLDSDDDIDLDNINVDDGASSEDEGSNSDSGSASSGSDSRRRRIKRPSKDATKKNFIAKDAPDSSDSGKQGSEIDGDERDSFSDAESHDGQDDEMGMTRVRDTRSKRNDPEAMSIAMQKILASKTPASRRADPIVARSADAAAAARQAVDAALETKARKRLREQKRLAKEKGRVRDVLVASTTRTLNVATGEIEEKVDEGESTAQILETEKRLRKVAQRGVVKLFNAVRAAQVKAAEAERVVRKEGVVGSKRKEEKITEMSKKGFLDLIAGGGGGLKKGGLEEA
ncbi:Rrp15p-domain-containing protein [Echria macrotheca]|uniref:Rrp15p-domain-containing protein n=1 Tax=Echria macrotheca TaxID=438768 RepID=A0AAJ0BLD2_9PEZI|nr:Rrp15p-domain-containing protein [Echria macrotheca]